jgi:nucleoside-diphosphate-sugar epimerase
MTERILVLGATGAMGIHLLPRFAEDKDVDVFATSRRPKPQGAPDRVSWAQGDAKDPAFLSELVRGGGFDAIIDFMNYSSQQFAERAAWLTGKTGHYLFLSSARVFARSDSPISESSDRLLDVSTDKRYLSTDEYALAKARQENRLRSLKRTNWTILRPYITYSTNRFQLGTLEAPMLLNRAERGAPVALPNEMLDRLTTMTWAGDVARMIHALTLRPSAMGEDFNLASEEAHSWREVAEIYRREIGLICLTVDVRRFILSMGWPYQTRYDRLFDRSFKADKITAEIGLERFRPLPEGLSAELRSRDLYDHPRHWLREGGMDRLVKRWDPPRGAGPSALALYLLGRSSGRLTAAARTARDKLRRGQ